MEEVFNRVARRRRSGQQGFTLIELLVVIAILAILAAVVIFNIIGVTNRGKNAAACTDVKTVQSAADAYYNDNSQAWPTAGGTLPGAVVFTDLVPAYIHQNPAAADGTFNINANGQVTATNATGC